ncbi:MAG: glutamate racemase [Spirochaetia bacterium]|nr:glutamate racemase [Spirochaetota bacterium]MDW8113046.1 glutamate racemase [Spirochaetia bacterium]
MDRRPIGIFDSGVGGLTVLKQVVRFLPNESIIYLGDTKHLPYGDKSKDAVIRFSIENTKFLISQDVKAIVIACNSASSVATPVLKEKFNLPIVDVIEPTVECVASDSPKSVLVIGTIRTIRSKVFNSKITSLNSNISVSDRACPVFVPMVEEGAFIDKDSDLYKALEKTISHYLADFKGKVDSVIMGCTHYPLIRDEIASFIGDGVKLIDPGECSAIKLKEILEQNEMLSDGYHKFTKLYVTDLSERTREVVKMIMGNGIEIEEVNISET